jgi:hypothetical protein
VRLTCRVVDGAGYETFSPEFVVEIAMLPEVSPEKLQFEARETLRLAAQVVNTTTGPGAVTVTFQQQTPAGWIDRGTDSLDFKGLGRLQAAVSGAFPRGRHTYRVITTVMNPLSNQQDDTLQTVLETTTFWVTPELGTTADLLTHGVVGVEGLDIDVPAGEAAAKFLLQITELDSVAAATQPGFQVQRLDSRRAGFAIEQEEGVAATLTWEVDQPLPQDSRIYRYDEEYRCWLMVETEELNDSTVQFQGEGPARYAFFTTEDAFPPRLEATVNGQRFLRNSYVNTTPVITITAQDRNGVDPRPEKMQLWMNNRPAPRSWITEVTGRANMLAIRLQPKLAEGDSTLALVVRDASGNVSDTLALNFIVRAKLALIDYGNFPNPFKDQTRFTYELTETVDDFLLEIFTVDGRRIRRFDARSALTDLDPRIGAYHEIVWDGRDAHGSFVANGVYFYRMRAKKGKTVIEQRGKVAKAR